MKKLILLLFLFFFSYRGIACPFCNKRIRDGIYDSQFYPNLFLMLLAFIVLAIVVAVLTFITTRKHKAWLKAYPHAAVVSPVPLTTASVVTGIGLGGFVDGIFLHQITQVHEMLSNKIPDTNYIGKSVNMFWDGIFHAFCLFVVITGVVLLWRLLWRTDIDRSGKLFAAGLLSGWGIFNGVEGTIDHQILKLHNVVENAANHDTGNYIFLGTSVVFLAIGGWMIRNEDKKRYVTV